MNWDNLSGNPNAIHLLEQNMDKIDWVHLSGNPNAIHLLEENPDKIDWSWLSLNPNAIHLFEQYPNKIGWFEIYVIHLFLKKYIIFYCFYYINRII